MKQNNNNNNKNKNKHNMAVYFFETIIKKERNCLYKLTKIHEFQNKTKQKKNKQKNKNKKTKAN